MSPQVRVSFSGQAGGGKEVFTTAVYSPVYCTQHPSLDTNLDAWTKKILIIKIQCVCVCMPLLCVLVLIVTEPHPSVVCSHVRTGADAEPAQQHGGSKWAQTRI